MRIVKDIRDLPSRLLPRKFVKPLLIKNHRPQAPYLQLLEVQNQPQKKGGASPLVPDNLMIPLAVGGGFLAALIAVVIVMKASSR
ncbi:hypothetical protein L0F63_003396 [Massospora cicadina]|nr:hypothetical protein L0F63_003396 [Massospora cicadina]